MAIDGAMTYIRPYHTNEWIDELEAENSELRNRLDAIEVRLDVVESGDAGREGKLRQIVTGGENVRTGDQTAVVMEAAKIATVIGVSSYHAHVAQATGSTMVVTLDDDFERVDGLSVKIPRMDDEREQLHAYLTPDAWIEH